jgi:hypothetical protein
VVRRKTSAGAPDSAQRSQACGSFRAAREEAPGVPGKPQTARERIRRKLGGAPGTGVAPAEGAAVMNGVRRVGQIKCVRAAVSWTICDGKVLWRARILGKRPMLYLLNTNKILSD